MTIGRDASADVHLDNRALSRRHAQRYVSVRLTNLFDTLRAKAQYQRVNVTGQDNITALAQRQRGQSGRPGVRHSFLHSGAAGDIHQGSRVSRQGQGVVRRE